jgi:lipopolysaccharide biosynthesis glycosyltransferase
MSLPVVDSDERPNPSNMASVGEPPAGLFPPRPRAIVTLLHSADFLPGTQTLLYSLRWQQQQQQQKSSVHHPNNNHQRNLSSYPPEIVVLVTPNVVLPTRVYQDLCPALCTRILPIEEWYPSSSSSGQEKKKTSYKRTLDNHCPGWTKLHIFGLPQYDTILYIDSDCLVLQDVSNLLHRPDNDNNNNNVDRTTKSEALIAAAPDILPPHHFNSGVMLIRPSTKTMRDMKRYAQGEDDTNDNTNDELLQHRHRRRPTDHHPSQSDTEFLNAYFSTWHTEFPPSARLPVGYNAPQVLYDMTVDDESGDGQSHFWNVHIAPKLFIVHYSNPIKPWQIMMERTKNETLSSSSSFLQTLWETWYTKSTQFLQRRGQQRPPPRQEVVTADHCSTSNSSRRQQQQQQQQKQPPFLPSALSQQDPRRLHRLIAQRFKELKRQGKSSKDAMKEARQDYGQGGSSSSQDTNPGMAVAALFGMR